ncbi:MAG: hypothetical protein AAF441_21180 [Pseudomonadota bacterium]
MPAGLEVAGEKDIEVEQGRVVMGGLERRSYVRTERTDFVSNSFVAEVAATVTSPAAEPAAGMVFLGMGAGEAEPDPAPQGFWSEPHIEPHAYMRAAPQGFAGGYLGVTSHGVENPVPRIDGGSKTGTHRLRLSWDAGARKAKFEIHRDYTGGPFVASETLGWIDCSENGFETSNTRVFIGGPGGYRFEAFEIGPI